MNAECGWKLKMDILPLDMRVLEFVLSAAFADRCRQTGTWLAGRVGFATSAFSKIWSCLPRNSSPKHSPQSFVCLQRRPPTWATLIPTEISLKAFAFIKNSIVALLMFQLVVSSRCKSVPFRDCGDNSNGSLASQPGEAEYIISLMEMEYHGSCFFSQIGFESCYFIISEAVPVNVQCRHWLRMTILWRTSQPLEKIL